MQKKITRRRFAIACLAVCSGVAAWWTFDSTADERSLYGYWRSHSPDGETTHDVHLGPRGRLGFREFGGYERTGTVWQADDGRMWTRDQATLSDWWRSLRSFELPQFSNQFVGCFELVSPDEFHYWADGEDPESYFRFVRITETTPPILVADENPADAAPSGAPVQESP